MKRMLARRRWRQNTVFRLQAALLACSAVAATLLGIDVCRPGPQVVVGFGADVRSAVLARLYVGTLNSIAVPAVLAPAGKADWGQRLAAVDSGAWGVTAESAASLLVALNPRVRAVGEESGKNVFDLSAQVSAQLPEGLEISDITPNGIVAVYRIGVLTYRHSKGLGILADQLTEADLVALADAVAHGGDVDTLTAHWLVEHNFNKTNKEKLEDTL